jgi:hypothetical protein
VQIKRLGLQVVLPTGNSMDKFGLKPNLGQTLNDRMVQCAYGLPGISVLVSVPMVLLVFPYSSVCLWSPWCSSVSRHETTSSSII